MGGRGSGSGAGADPAGRTARLQDIAGEIRTKSNEELLSSIQKLKPVAETARYDEFGNVITSQVAETSDGKYRLQIGFSNDYDPRQVGTARTPIKTSIEAYVWENGHISTVRKLAETKTKSLKNAGKNYQSMLATWEKLIGK